MTPGIQRSIHEADEHRESIDDPRNTEDPLVHRKKNFSIFPSRPQPWCHLPDSPWAGIIYIWRHNSHPGRVWWVTSRLGTWILKSLFYGVKHMNTANQTNDLGNTEDQFVKHMNTANQKKWPQEYRGSIHEAHEYSASIDDTRNTEDQFMMHRKTANQSNDSRRVKSQGSILRTQENRMSFNSLTL